MAEVHLEGPEPNGLAEMIAGLVQANLAAEPARSRLLASARGAVQIDVPDAGVVIGLKFVPGAVTVASRPVPGADARLRARAEALLGLSTTPLRRGLPDLTTAAGRDLVRAVVSGRVRLRLRPSGVRLLRVALQLLNVA